MVVPVKFLLYYSKSKFSFSVEVTDSMIIEVAVLILRIEEPVEKPFVSSYTSSWCNRKNLIRISLIPISVAIIYAFHLFCSL